MTNSEKVNLIILECIESALNQVVPEEKEDIYNQFTNNYNLEIEDIPGYYSEFIDVLESKLPKKRYYEVIRSIIRILHKRATQGAYKETVAIEAFNKVVSVNMQKTTERMEKTQTIMRDKQKTFAEQQEKLKTMERLAAIGQTAGMIGHDIRNPLQSIIGELYLAKEELVNINDCEAKQNLRESLSLIEENLGYINKIVSDLQDFARPIKPEITSENLDSIVEGVLEAVFIPKNIEMVLDLKGAPAVVPRMHMVLLAFSLQLASRAFSWRS